MAMRGDTIVAVGTNAEVEPFIGSETEVIELEGHLAVPGLIDGHAHFMGVGRAPNAAKADGDQELGRDRRDGRGSSGQCRARRVDSRQGLASREVGQSSRAQRGRLAAPQRVEQDSPGQSRPAQSRKWPRDFRKRQSDGARWCYQATKPPEGGEIVRDAQGNPIGVFRETASLLVAPSSEWNETTATKMAILAAEECLSKGITSFHDAGTSIQTIELYRKLIREGKMPIRLWVMVSGSE